MNFLPTLNAALNLMSAVLLVTGLIFIKRKNITAHKICMLSAFFLSCAFLASYLTYHFHEGVVRFKGLGWIRPVYFTILISHTLLAAVVPVLAIVTIRFALLNRFGNHRRIARVTLPVWLYVSVTGVVVYWMLFHA